MGGSIASIATQAANLGIRAILSDAVPAPALPWLDAIFQVLTTLAGLHIALARVAAKASLSNAVRCQALALGWAAAHTATHMLTPLLTVMDTPTWPAAHIHKAVLENIGLASAMAMCALGGVVWRKRGRGVVRGGGGQYAVAVALLLLLAMLPLWETILLAGLNTTVGGGIVSKWCTPSVLHALLSLLLSAMSWLVVAPRLV